MEVFFKILLYVVLAITAAFAIIFAIAVVRVVLGIDAASSKGGPEKAMKMKESVSAVIKNPNGERRVH